MAYIDTSVLVAYYCPEPLSRRAQAALRRERVTAVSPLTEVEFCSALSLKTRGGDMAKADAERILSLFRLHLEERRHRILPIDAATYALACDWLARFSTPLRTVDAIHLAVAFANDLKLVTADKGLARSAKHFGVKHKLIA